MMELKKLDEISAKLSNPRFSYLSAAIILSSKKATIPLSGPGSEIDKTINITLIQPTIPNPTSVYMID